MVALERGGCFLRDCKVRPANSGTWPCQKGLLQGGEGQAEKHGMGKCYKISCTGAAKGGVGMESEWLAHIQFPEFCCWGVVTLEDNSIIVADGDSVGGEGNIAPGIAQLTNGEEWLSGKKGYNVSMSCHSQEAREIQVASCMDCKMAPDGVWMAMGLAVSCLQMGVDGEKK